MLDGTHAKPGTPVTIIPYKSRQGKDGQRWALKRSGQFYQFINVETDRAMELSKGHRIKGSVLQASTPNDFHDQLFCIPKPRDLKYCGNGKKAPKQRRNQQRDDIFDTESNFARKAYFEPLSTI